MIGVDECDTGIEERSWQDRKLRCRANDGDNVEPPGSSLLERIIDLFVGAVFTGPGVDNVDVFSDLPRAFRQVYCGCSAVGADFDDVLSGARHDTIAEELSLRIV